MEIKGFFLVFATISHLILGISVFLNKPNENANRTFALFAFSLSLWTFINFLISLSTRYDTIIILGKFAFASSCLPQPLLLTFFLIFLQFTKINKIKLLVTFLPTTFFVCLSFTDLLQKDIAFTKDGFRPIYGPLFKYHAYYLAIYMIIAILLPVIKFKKIKDPLIKNQLKYVLVGLSIPAIIIFLNNIFFPLFKGFRPFFGLSQASTVIIVGFISYAIIKYRFMDFYVFLRKIIVYSILVFIYMILLSLLLITFKYLSESTSIANIFYSSLLISFIIALLFPFLKTPTETIVNKFIFPGQYNYQKDLKTISKDLGKLYNLSELENFLVERITEIMQVKGATLVIFNGNPKGSTSLKEIEKRILETSLFHFLKEKKEILVQYELKRTLPPAIYANLSRGFEILDAVVIIPLMIKEDIIGFISLGEKKSGDIYSIEDINFLSTLGNQTAVAIQNAKLYNQILQIKEYNENILEQMANGVITVDTEMKITTFNKKAREMINVSPWMVLGKRIDMIEKEIALLLQETMKSERGFSNVETFITPNKGPRIPINCSTSLLKNPDGQTIGALAVFTDLTEIKQLETEVRRAERLATVGTLAAGMAHEIKNPLVSLKTFTQLLPTKYDDPEFRGVFAEIASQEVDRINNIVEQLLRFAAPSRPIFSPTDIHQTIDQTLFLLGNEISKRRIKIEKNFSSENFIILADNEQLKQVFINIIMNAIDALQKTNDPIIHITTEIVESNRSEIFNFAKLMKGYSLTNKELVVKISDNGVGIPEKILNHIFDPFFTTKDKGHGLGLSIAHGIIKEHGGIAVVQSKIGKGTTFSISFPVIDQVKEDWKESSNEAFADRIQ